MTVTEITQIGTLLIASVSVTIGLKAFARRKREELENHLFKIKLEALSNIAFEIDNFFIVLNRAIVQFYEYSGDNVDEKISKIKNLSMEVDEQIYKCHSLISKYSVYFSRSSLEKLLLFTDNLLGKSYEESEDLLVWIENYYDVQQKLSNEAINHLRIELQLERLHTSLFTRSGK